MTKAWRVIHNGAAGAAFNMALDEAILLSHARGRVPATLRFYTWTPSAVSIGYAQQLDKTLDLEACKGEGVEVVRRVTGGRAVLHDHEVTYSLVVSTVDLPEGVTASVTASYRWVAEALQEGLKDLGVEAYLARPERASVQGRLRSGVACYDSPSFYELCCQGRKIVGSSQYRHCGSLLQHGSIPLRFDASKLVRLLPQKGEEVRQRLERQLQARGAGLSDITGRPLETTEVVGAIIRGFERVHGVSFESSLPLAEEMEAALSLRDSKYATREWTALR